MGRDRRTQRKLQATRNTTQVKNKPAGFFDGLPFFEPLDSLPDEGFYRGNAVFRWSTLKFMAQCRTAFVMDAVHDGGIEKLLGCNCKFLVAMTKNALSTASVTEFQCIEFECFPRMRGTGRGFKIWRRCQKRNPPPSETRGCLCASTRERHIRVSWSVCCCPLTRPRPLLRRERWILEIVVRSIRLGFPVSPRPLLPDPLMVDRRISTGCCTCRANRRWAIGRE